MKTRLLPNVAVLFEQMSWPSVHSGCEASYKARYGGGLYADKTAVVKLTQNEAIKLATIEGAYTAVFSEYRTLKETMKIVSAIRKACREERCKWCEER